MKKILSIICGLGLLAGGCGDFLDIVPDNDIKTIETIFEQRSQVDQWVATCYRSVGSFQLLTNNVAYTGADEVVGNNIMRNGMGLVGSIDGFKIGDGLQSSLDPIADSWTGSSYYGSIRYCNTFFEHIDETNNMEPEEKELWTAEVKAVKAYYYFQLVRKYGPIILLDNTIDVTMDTEDMIMPRSHVDTCFKEIVRLLDEAIEVLPLKAEKTNSRQGYFHKESAMALKAIALVYQASPLFNGNPHMVNFTGRDGEPLFSSTTDPEKWRVAAEACDAAIELCEANGWELEHGNTVQNRVGDNATLFNTIKDIEESVMIRNYETSEVILWSQSTPNSDIGAPAFYYGHTIPAFWTQSFQLRGGNVSSGSLSPTMKMVEMYYTDNGVPMNEDNTYSALYADIYGRAEDSEWDADKYEDVLSPSSEWGRGRLIKLHVRREPRFYAHIAFDRGYWRGPINNQNDEPTLIEAYRDEAFGTYLQRLDPLQQQNRSGYWLLKFLDMNETLDGYYDNIEDITPMPVIRLAQLYLMSSEAWNEYLDNSTDPKVLYGINKVRERAGLPDVVTAWSRYSTNPGKPNTRAGMREIIHQETEIELAFEGQRFWDLRRWLDCDQLNEPLYGWNVVADNADGFYNNGNGPVQVWTLRGFQSPRDYFWPINSEEVRTSGLVQNPGW